MEQPAYIKIVSTLLSMKKAGKNFDTSLFSTGQEAPSPLLKERFIELKTQADVALTSVQLATTL